MNEQDKDEVMRQVARLQGQITAISCYVHAAVELHPQAPEVRAKAERLLETVLGGLLHQPVYEELIGGIQDFQRHYFGTDPKAP